MAYYALLDENNFVIQVITGVNEWETQVDSDGTVIGGSTEAWENWYAYRPWLNAAGCKRTSFNAAINGYRKNYAGIGYLYDSIRDAFIPPKPFDSWLLDEDTCQWKAPVEYPTDGKVYTWDEDSKTWVEVAL